MKNKAHITYIFLIILLILPIQIKSQTWKELLDRADSLYISKNYESAIVLGEQAVLQIKMNDAVKESTLANILELIGKCFFAKQAFGIAESLYAQVLNIRKNQYGLNHLKVAESLLRLGEVEWELEKDRLAEPLLSQSLKIMKINLIADNPFIALNVKLLGDVALDKSDFAVAESYFNRAISIWENCTPVDTLNIGEALRKIAQSIAEQGRANDAIKHLQRALQLYERKFGLENIHVANSLQNLGICYATLGKSQEAIQVLERSLQIRAKVLQPDDPDIIKPYRPLSDAYSQLGRFAEAESLQLRTIEFRHRIWGDLNPNYAFALLAYGRFLNNQKRFQCADSILQKALWTFEKIDYGGGLNLSETLEELAETNIFFREFAQAATYAKRAFDIRRRILERIAMTTYETNALVNNEKKNRLGNLFLSSYFQLAQHDQDSLITQASEVVLDLKGQMLDILSLRAQNIAKQSEPIIVQLRDSLTLLSEIEANYYVQFAMSNNSAEYSKKLKQIQQERSKLEARLAQSITTFNDTATLCLTHASIVKSLTPGFALIEFFKHNARQSLRVDGKSRYIALIISQSNGTKLLDIGEATLIDSIVSLWRNCVLQADMRGLQNNQRIQNEYQNISLDLYNRIWKPIRSSISKSATVLIAPDGGLNLISFAGLMDEDGKYLIEKHPIQYLSAGRDLIRMKGQEKSGSGLLAFGDPDYDAVASERLVNKPIASTTIGTKEQNPYQVRNVRSGCMSLHEVKVTPLPGTRSEVEAISTSWHNNFPDELSAIYFGPDASEEHLKKDIPGKRIIHLATHGYYINSECADKKNKNASYEIKYSGENPLLLSGLLLAGANLQGADADNVDAEDGILTALEVSTMDLRGTDLVVLSACETGLGEVKQGEGVYGLRRAFQLAGARTVVSSLWQVPDRETTTFMKILYSQNAKSYPELFQKAAIQRLNELRLRKQSTHPYSWAGFIATGDWKIK
jgi:CHAT domain-containing protein/Tfp pilus assembly protein PilF